MTLIKHSRAYVKTTWFFKKRRLFIWEDHDKEYKEINKTEYYDIDFISKYRFNINKKNDRESYLEQREPIFDGVVRLLKYKFIKNNFIESPYNHIVSNKLYDSVCYELMLVTRIKNKEYYEFSWDNSMMTEKEAIELTASFLLM